ncbi:AAA family ATPase [Taibaiella soli]|uniref:ATPase n=1 Tax=Taibaiella soli TaxID=1649169 RepID=A0A2W2B6H3_9BACT|nr:ATP-binding protein [Taibaiella soli]PZF71587.1 ATPase [Taibaiella soli]
MAAADQIKNLIKSFGESDEVRFFSTAMQIAATEARQGHATFAQELKALIEKAKKERSSSIIETKSISLSLPKRELHELIEVFVPRIKLNDLVLDESIKTPLLKLIEEQQRWEELKKHNLEPTRKLLLTGEPGTGKTMTAQAIAGELDIAVYIIRLDGLMSKYLGESISKLRLIFDTMQSHRAVYLFDEFDSIGSHRNQGQDIGEIKRVLNSFLINIEKDKSNSIIIAATNLPDSLDIALFRRFDEIISYPLPDKKQIKEVIQKCTKPYSFATKPNYESLAAQAIGMNYSDITRACNEVIKNMILSHTEKLDTDLLKTVLKKRK